MQKEIPENALVVVADGRKAIFFRRLGKLDELAIQEESRLCPKDLIDDGPSGSRPEDQTAQQTDEATFAKQLANALYKMKKEGAFSDLVLLADPQTLGQLRDALHEKVTESIILTLAKDFTNHSTKDIISALTSR